MFTFLDNVCGKISTSKCSEFLTAIAAPKNTIQVKLNIASSSPHIKD